MKVQFLLKASLACLALAVALAPITSAQHAKPNAAARQASSYNQSKEQTVQGTVVQFVEKSDAAPMGAHVLLQTATGPVDVHLGDARLLKQHNFTFESGNFVRFVGVTRATGGSTVFLARVIQAGSTTIAVRNANGVPYRFAGTRATQNAQAALQTAGAR